MNQDTRLYLVAKMYYIDQMKQNEIADALQIQSMAVSRLLRRAEQEGIVTFHVQEPNQINWNLGKEFKKKYPHMKEVIVVDVLEGQDARVVVGKAAAFYLKGIINKNSVIGISWGRVIQRFTEALPNMDFPDVRVLQMSGGFLCAHEEAMMPSNLVKSMSERLHCGSCFLNAPLIVESNEIRTALMKDALLQYMEELSAKMDVSIYGLSALSRKTTMSNMGLLPEESYNELLRLGAVGDVMGYFIGEDGQLIKWSRWDCYMGTSIQTAISAPNAICLASGVEKRQILELALKFHYCNTLIVSSDLANALLNRAAEG